MFVREEPTNEKSLEKILQKARETELPFVLDLTHLDSLCSRSIRDIIDAHALRQDRFYILLPANSRLIEMFKREALLGVLTLFNRLKDIERVISHKRTPCYLDYFPGKLFEIRADYQQELNQGIDHFVRKGISMLSPGLRDEFKRRGFALPPKLAIVKENEEWQICEHDDRKAIIQANRKTVLYIFRTIPDSDKLEVCQRMLVFSLYGTLHSKELAENFFITVNAENPPLVFIDLDNCYSWDQHFADAFKRLKEYKKLYLIRQNRDIVDFLFKLEGDKVYKNYLTAYKQAELILTKQWRIVPDPIDDEYSEPQPVIELSGYVSDQEDEIVKFRRKLVKILKKNLKHLQKVCLDIRELYRLEKEARKAFLDVLINWLEKNKIKKYNVIIVATLPRPDYIVHDVIAELYANEFFIVSSIEQAMDMHAAYPHPRFITENSLNTSLLTLEGNIINEREKIIFEGEVNNMIQHALSLSDNIGNVIKSPQKVVYFDFRTIPCVYIPVVQAIIDIDHRNKNLIKILLVSSHLQELAKKLVHSHNNILCYSDKDKALRNHLCNILVVTPKKISSQAKTYFKKVVEELYDVPEAENTQLRVYFHFDFDRLASRLTTENYNLVIIYGYSLQSGSDTISRLLRECNKPVLELKKGEDGWLQLFSHQLEMDCSIDMLKAKIIETLWKENQTCKQNSFIVQGNLWPRVQEELLRDCLGEQEQEILGKFLPIKADGNYEVILTHPPFNPKEPVPVQQASREKMLEKIEIHPYRQWQRCFTFHYLTSLIELMHLSQEERETANLIDLLRDYASVKKRIWETIPNQVKKTDSPRWISYLAAKNKLFGMSFRSKSFEIQYISLYMHMEIKEIFNGHLWLGLCYVKEQLRKDLRYRYFEAPLLSVLKFIYCFLNDESFQYNISWIGTAIEVHDKDGIEIVLSTENISGRPTFPGEVSRCVDQLKTKYKIDINVAMEEDSRLIQIKFYLKSKMQKRLITIKK